RPGRAGGDLRRVPPGGQRLHAKARRDRARPGALAEVRRAARRADLGQERGGQGVDVHLHPTGETMAGELILIVEDNEKNLKLVAAGFDGYQSKPIRVKDFLEAVRAMLDRK